MTDQFTEPEVNHIFAKARSEEHHYNCTWYNSYLELVYKVPQFQMIKTPQWSHISSIKFKEGFFYIKVAVFKRKDTLYCIETAIKHDFLTIKI